MKFRRLSAALISVHIHRQVWQFCWLSITHLARSKSEWPNTYWFYNLWKHRKNWTRIQEWGRGCLYFKTIMLHKCDHERTSRSECSRQWASYTLWFRVGSNMGSPAFFLRSLAPSEALLAITETEGQQDSSVGTKSDHLSSISRTHMMGEDNYNP